MGKRSYLATDPTIKKKTDFILPILKHVSYSSFNFSYMNNIFAVVCETYAKSRAKLIQNLVHNLCENSCETCKKFCMKLIQNLVRNLCEISCITCVKTRAKLVRNLVRNLCEISCETCAKPYAKLKLVGTKFRSDNLGTKI